jgi:hypothetical protein
MMAAQKATVGFNKEAIVPGMTRQISDSSAGFSGATLAAPCRQRSAAVTPLSRGFRGDQAVDAARSRRLVSGRLVWAVGWERDDDVGWFGIMSRQASLSCVRPAGDLDDLPRLLTQLAVRPRLQDVKTINVQKERVIAESLVQLW